MKLTAGGLQSWALPEVSQSKSYWPGSQLLFFQTENWDDYYGGINESFIIINQIYS